MAENPIYSAETINQKALKSAENSQNPHEATWGLSNRFLEITAFLEANMAKIDQFQSFFRRETPKMSKKSEKLPRKSQNYVKGSPRNV